MGAAGCGVAAGRAGVGADPAVWVEDKDGSFVVHARLATDPGTACAAGGAPVTALADRHGLGTHPGKQVLEGRGPGVMMRLAGGTGAPEWRRPPCVSGQD